MFDHRRRHGAYCQRIYSSKLCLFTVFQSQEDVKEELDDQGIEIDRLSNYKNSNSPGSAEKDSEIDDEPSHLSVKPEYSPQRLAEIAPKIGSIMSSAHQQNKQFEKYEVAFFEKLFKCMKYKYENIIKVLNLYSDVSVHN